MFCINKINVHVSLETLYSFGTAVIPRYFRCGNKSHVTVS